MRAAATNAIVISQVYGGGGNAGATLRNDFIELFNRGNTTVSLAGWSVQYAAATGDVVDEHHAAERIDRAWALLPRPGIGRRRRAASSFPRRTQRGSIAMGATAGKVALVNSTTALSGSGARSAERSSTSSDTARRPTAPKAHPLPHTANATAVLPYSERLCGRGQQLHRIRGRRAEPTELGVADHQLRRTDQPVGSRRGHARDRPARRVDAAQGHGHARAEPDEHGDLRHRGPRPRSAAPPSSRSSTTARTAT